MKKIKCYDCEVEFQSETRDEVLNQLYAHYMKEHKETIMGADESEKKRWMEQFNKDWETAEEV